VVHRAPPFSSTLAPIVSRASGAGAHMRLAHSAQTPRAHTQINTTHNISINRETGTDKVPTQSQTQSQPKAKKKAQIKAQTKTKAQTQT
jgi:hypothetical protein